MPAPPFAPTSAPATLPLQAAPALPAPARPPAHSSVALPSVTVVSPLSYYPYARPPPASFASSCPYPPQDPAHAQFQLPHHAQRPLPQHAPPAPPQPYRPALPPHYPPLDAPATSVVPSLPPHPPHLHQPAFPDPAHHHHRQPYLHHFTPDPHYYAPQDPRPAPPPPPPLPACPRGDDPRPDPLAPHAPAVHQPQDPLYPATARNTRPPASLSIPATSFSTPTPTPPNLPAPTPALSHPAQTHSSPPSTLPLTSTPIPPPPVSGPPLANAPAFQNSPAFIPAPPSPGLTVTAPNAPAVDDRHPTASLEQATMEIDQSMLNTSQSISRQNDIPAINPAAIVQAPGNGTATHENASVDAAKPTAGGISPASVPRPSNPKKRPHRSISHAEKRRLCELQDQHPEARHNCIAKLFLDESGHRVERSTVTRVLQRKDFWLKAGTTDSNRKRLTSPRFPIIEEAMYELIRNRALSQSLRSKLHDRNLMQISREIASAMSDKHGSLDKNSPNYSPNLAQFRGSLSWIQSFKKRHALFPEDDESTDGFQLRPPASPLMVYDIWQTELNMSITQRELGDYTRLEDVYMLEATVLATTAMPEHVKEASVNTPAVASQDADAPSNDDFGLMNASYNDRDSGSGGIDSSVPNFIDFPLSSPGSSWNAQRSNSSSGHEPHSGFSQSQPQDSLTCASPNVDRGSRDQASTARNAVDEDDIVVALLCSNAIGQRPAPWLVGRRPLKTVGKREGEVWHDSTIRYFHNAKGWLTARIIKKWLVEFDASVDRPVAVLTSLLTRCDIDLLKLKKVSVMPLPSTSWHGRHRSAPMWRSKSSPLYHGIEETFRTKYRCMVMNKAIQTVCRGTHVKPIPLKATAGMIWEAWGNVPVPVIRRAWRDLSYMPARLHRSCGQPRMKPGTVNAQIHELTKLLRTYKGALAQTFGGVRHSVRPADIEYAINNPEKYVWLAAESSVFHPKGTVADFVRSVCSAQKSKDYGMEDVSVPGKFPTPPITSYEEALLLTNKLAEFMKNDEELNKEQSLYLVSALQLEFKRLYDHRQDTEQTNAWPTANVRSSV